MTKKAKPERPRGSEKSPTSRSAANSKARRKPATLKKGSKPEILKEVGPKDSIEKNDQIAPEVVPTIEGIQETGEPGSSQPTADERAVTDLHSPSETVAPPIGGGKTDLGSGSRSAAPESEEVLELLAFRLADEEYGVDILKIKEIIRLVEITHVPRRPAFVKGIISLRGTILPVLDIRTSLGLAESPPSRGTRILVVGLDKGLSGLIADEVTAVVKVKMGDIELPPVTGGGQTSGHLKGVTRVNGRLLIILDLEKVFTWQ